MYEVFSEGKPKYSIKYQIRQCSRTEGGPRTTQIQQSDQIRQLTVRVSNDDNAT